MDRFEFQRQCVRNAGEEKVLNVGCHVDGGNLKYTGPNVFNCDVEVQMGWQYQPDYLFDARFRWPFDDESVGLVVLGDILEHMFDHEILDILKEARRVSRGLCITVPQAPPTEDELQYVKDNPDLKYKCHCNFVTKEKIVGIAEEAGWNVDYYEWESGPIWEGHLLAAS